MFVLFFYIILDDSNIKVPPAQLCQIVYFPKGNYISLSIHCAHFRVQADIFNSKHSATHTH